MYRENLTKLLTKHSPTFQSLVEEYRDLWNQNVTRFNYINELGNEVRTFVQKIILSSEDVPPFKSEAIPIGTY